MVLWMEAAVIFDEDDLHSAALCAWKEARGDGEEACLAVLWVISNRCWDWSKSVHDVVYGKNQFSSMSVVADPEYNLMPGANDVMWTYCLGAAPSALNRDTDDPTKGSHYYWNPHTATSSWFSREIAGDATNHPMRGEFGKQQFFA